MALTISGILQTSNFLISSVSCTRSARQEVNYYGQEENCFTDIYSLHNSAHYSPQPLGKSLRKAYKFLQTTFAYPLLCVIMQLACKCIYLTLSHI